MQNDMNDKLTQKDRNGKNAAAVFGITCNDYTDFSASRYFVRPTMLRTLKSISSFQSNAEEGYDPTSKVRFMIIRSMMFLVTVLLSQRKHGIPSFFVHVR